VPSPARRARDGGHPVYPEKYLSGYSGTPLVQKLGIKPSHRVALLNAPTNFEKSLDDLPLGVAISHALPRSAKSPANVIVCFVTTRAEFEKRLPAAAAKLAQDGGLWIAWPKKASKVPTDMTEQTIRDVALPTGLVDNKVCAIDDTWSGLRLVIRKELRSKM
jgi:hypothetical protein